MLDQVGLNDIFNRVAFFAYGGGEAIDPNRATIELMDNRFKQLAVRPGAKPRHANLGSQTVWPWFDQKIR